MAKIIIIAAIGKNKELGKNNDLIWHLKEDLKFFKQTTMNHKVIMGYNTYTSLPKNLPGREYILLTHKDINIDNGLVFHDLESLLIYLKTLDEDIYIIGGASIYKMFIDYAAELLLTEIDAEDKEADAYFPNWNLDNYELEVINEINDNPNYKHVRYRKNS